MKKDNIGVIITILIIFCLSFILGACYSEMTSVKEDQNTDDVDEYVINSTIREIYYQNHYYLYNLQGGIIHSESCPCYYNETDIKPSDYDE